MNTRFPFRPLALVSVVGGLLMGLSACGPQSQTPSAKATSDAATAAVAQEQAAPGKRLMLAVKGEPEQGFDPIKGWGEYGNPLFQSTLIKRDADLRLVGDLAT